MKPKFITEPSSGSLRLTLLVKQPWSIQWGVWGLQNVPLLAGVLQSLLLIKISLMELKKNRSHLVIKLKMYIFCPPLLQCKFTFSCVKFWSQCCRFYAKLLCRLWSLPPPPPLLTQSVYLPLSMCWFQDEPYTSTWIQIESMSVCVCERVWERESVQIHSSCTPWVCSCVLTNLFC